MTISHCDTLIHAAWVVTQDDSRRILEDAGIAVSNGFISAIGSWEELAPVWYPKRIVDLTKHLVLPGLINAHTHASMTLMRGLADDLPLMEWLTKHIFPVEQKLTPELVHLGALLACCEMTKTGTTAFCDMYLMEEHVGRAAEEAGLRARIGEVLFSFPSPAYASQDEAFDLVRSMKERFDGSNRVNTAVMPHSVYTTSPELLEKSMELAEELDIPLNIHLAETQTESQQSIEQHGLRPVPYAAERGLLSKRTLAAHAVDLTDEEIDLLAKSGTRVCHNPESNMKLASGIARVPEMQAAGIPLSLGTDGACSNNNLDMFSEMSSCALLQKVHHKDSTLVPAQQVLDMATRGGACSLDMPQTGYLAKGQAADLIALNLNTPSLMPMYNPISHLVYAAQGADVALTMVGGETLYQDGKFTRIDYPALREEIRDAAEFIKKQFEQGKMA